MTKVCQIEVEAHVADELSYRAQERGVSVSDVVADLMREQPWSTDLEKMRAEGRGPWSPEALAEDAAAWREYERDGIGVPWEDVKAWMESLGTPNELPPPVPRKLQSSEFALLRAF
jgi:hypothetical protein